MTNEILHAYGKPELPWTLKAQLQGRPYQQSMALLMAWSKLPISEDEYHAQVAALQQKYFPTCTPLPGVEALLATLRDAGTYVALATSSQSFNWRLKTAHLPDLFAHFPERLRVKGDDPRVAVGRGKPAPDIFLAALGAVNEVCKERGEKEVLPEECLAFEDSVPGVEAGRRAGMRIVWCPHPELLKVMRSRVEKVLAGRGEEKGQEQQGKEEKGGDGRPEELQEQTEGGLKGWPGRLGDGWGELVESLEGFDARRYGIEVK